MQGQTNPLSPLRRLLFLLLISNIKWSAASTPVSLNQPPAIGNFALATSQQPGPFFSFGQNVIDKNQFIVSFNPNYLYSQTQRILDGTPSILYGITDSASILLSLPYAFSYKNGNQSLSGVGDLALDLEYAFYNYENSRYSDQATIIFAPSFPVSTLDEITKKLNPSSRVSGFSRKSAPSSFDVMTYFIGATYSRMLVDWYGFIAPGALFASKKDSIQQGTQYYYNLGIGRTIKSAEKKYILFGLLEVNGQYSAKTKFDSLNVPNTGGSIIYATPSLSFSTSKIMLQAGLSLPVAQYWYGNQSNISYYASGIITWTIQ
ncbi:hypothetical protein [Legionella parisiensis]|uniref:Transporter n=1 Tax=Legionella parisiensis TaxID=45071 RepID=A0A1E5JQM0_9GAMM|nr:hypothetical protein [Legionella parisiensis]KTD40174.1 hypothetical protein Lpar_1491 [Legionella parisiensis]OEH46819.1 hypothetical protein lpari_02287 [Legionella parisiensis]STX77713.1 Uncharacterised protein [Legionella parisiensis]